MPASSNWSLLCVVLVVTVIPLGRYMAAVYGGGRWAAPGDRVFVPIERVIYRMLRVDERREQRWNVYTIALLAFSVVSFLFVYALERFQGSLLVQPDEHGGGRRRSARSTPRSAS